MKKILILIILTSLFLTSCGKQEEETQKKYYKTTTVQNGNVLDSDSFVGYTDSFNNVQLSAKAGGKIVSIKKNVGDKVSIGELIATLDSSEAKTGYSSSNEIIGSLETLKVSTSQMYDSQIDVMQEKIKSAKAGIEIAKVGVSGSEEGSIDTKNIIQNQLKTIDTQISTAETGFESAKLQLENTKNTLEQKETDIYSNSKNAISNANILASNIIDFLDNLFGITDANKNKNDSFDIYISAKNSNLKTEIENDFKKINSNFQELKSLPLDTNENIKNTLNKYNSLFSNDFRNILKKSYSAMENSISSQSFTETSINSYKSQISAFQNQNEQIILTVSGNYFLGLKGSIDSISSFNKEKKSSLDMMEKQVELAQKQIDTLNQTKEQINSQGGGALTDITTKTQIAQKQKDLSENSLNEVIASIEALKKQKQSALNQIETQISQVKSGKNDAGVMIENGKIISLIDGIITKKLQEVGDVVGAGTPILVASSNDKIKIEIQVDEEILAKIKVGNNVKVEIEGVNEIKDGIITKILPTRDMITKKSSLEITLDNTKKDIKIGSFAKVYFDVKPTNSGIIIPNSAVVQTYMIPQVFVLEGKVAKLRNIKILKQNDNFSQITGLNVGETIITDGKENVFDGERLN
ncbi:MAG: efflux RND transporter periplasmic adaptor subunit [Candidatus Gracilibacteria bacterium]|nr:efflux RND transporter periplasmic adaptor subunit [Candidatus Gracilibacteria bacterium]